MAQRKNAAKLKASFMMSMGDTCQSFLRYFIHQPTCWTLGLILLHGEGEKSRGWKKGHVVMFVSHYTVTHITASFTVMSFIGWVPDKVPWPAVSLLFVNPRDYLCDTITTTTCQGVRQGGGQRHAHSADTTGL